MKNSSPLVFRALSSFNSLGKQLLVLMDDLFLDSENARDALENTIETFNLNPKEKDLLIAIVNQGFLLNPNKKMGIRKRILDATGDIVRNFETEANKYNIEINRNHE